MLYGRMPFEGTTHEILKNKVRNFSGDNVQFPTNIQVSDVSKNLIKQLLQFDPQKRLEWVDFFKHPIF